MWTWDWWFGDNSYYGTTVNNLVDSANTLSDGDWWFGENSVWGNATDSDWWFGEDSLFDQWELNNSDWWFGEGSAHANLGGEDFWTSLTPWNDDTEFLGMNPSQWGGPSFWGPIGNFASNVNVEELGNCVQSFVNDGWESETAYATCIDSLTTSPQEQWGWIGGGVGDFFKSFQPILYVGIGAWALTKIFRVTRRRKIGYLKSNTYNYKSSKRY